MNITLGKEFERRITEKVSDGLYTSSKHSVMDIFEQASLAVDSKSTSKNTNVEL